MVAEYAVSHRITMLAQPGVPILSYWRYRPADPWAVTVELHWRGEVAPWVMARELIADGLRGLAGSSAGDVHVWPTDAGRVALHLSPPSGSSTLTAVAAQVRRFLARTYAWVPAGEESAHLDVDGALSRLLAEGSAP